MIKFIMNRLNKDNLWNLFFLLVVSHVISLLQANMELLPWGTAIFVISLFLVPWLVCQLNPVRFENEQYFSSSNGRVLPRLQDNSISGVLMLTVWYDLAFTHTFPWGLSSFETLPVIDAIRHIDVAGHVIRFWTIFIIYCFLRNLPISLIFNKNIWRIPQGTYSYQGSGAYSSIDTFSSHSQNNSYIKHSSADSTFRNSRDILTSSSNSWHSSNNYHRSSRR